MSGRFALIIGNSLYEDTTLAKLKSPEADVESLASALRNPEIGFFDDVQMLVNQRESDIRRAISLFFIEKKPDDLLLLYFSGHGVLDNQGRLFLAVKDTKRNLLNATGIASSYITNEMDSCRSKRQILVLDCCHSGAFARAGIKGEVSAVNRSTFEGSGFGRVVLTASGSTQVALEGDQVIQQTDLSLFTHFLIYGLESGEADIEKDGIITIDEWYNFVYDKIHEQTPDQTPKRWIYNQQGDLIIAKSLNVSKRHGNILQELRDALNSGLPTVRISAAKELEHLLTNENEQVVNAARNELNRIATGDDSLSVRNAAQKILEQHTHSIVPITNAVPIEPKKPIIIEKPAGVKSAERKPSTQNLSKRGMRFWGMTVIAGLVFMSSLYGIILSSRNPGNPPQPTLTSISVALPKKSLTMPVQKPNYTATILPSPTSTPRRVATRTLSPTIMKTSTPKFTSAENTVIQYYKLINEKDYKTAWDMLSPHFIELMNLTYNSYADGWESYKEIKVISVKETSSTISQVMVTADLIYVSSTGKGTNVTLYFHLTTESPSDQWTIYTVTRSP